MFACVYVCVLGSTYLSPQHPVARIAFMTVILQIHSCVCLCVWREKEKEKEKEKGEERETKRESGVCVCTCVTETALIFPYRTGKRL